MVYFFLAIMPVAVPPLTVPNCHSYSTMNRGGVASEPEPLKTTSSPTLGSLGENTKSAFGSSVASTRTDFDLEPLKPTRSVTVNVTE